MLTVSPLDEGSSMGTNTPQGDEASLMNENDGWGVVTEAEGVLILEGEEPEAPTLLSEGLQLSLPGTDSVPTIVGSIEALPAATDEKKQADDHDKDEKKEEAPTTLTSGFEEKVSTSNVNSTGSTPKPPKVSQWIPLLVSTVLLLCAFLNQHLEHQKYVQSLELNHERRLLRYTNEIIDLEAQNERLVDQVSIKEQYNQHLSQKLKNASEQKNRLAVRNQELERENERLKYEQAMRSDKKDSAEDTVLVDNCWLTAKAKVQLGDCAQSAQDSVQELTTSFLEHLQNTSAAFVETEETVSKIIHRVDSFGKEVASNLDSIGRSFWKSTRSSSSSSDQKLNDFFSKMDDTGKTWFQGLFAEEGGDAKSESKTPDTLDELIQEMSVAMKAGETFVHKALEKAAEAMEMSPDDLLEAAKQAFEEADLAKHLADKKTV